MMPLALVVLLLTPILVRSMPPYVEYIVDMEKPSTPVDGEQMATLRHYLQQVLVRRIPDVAIIGTDIPLQDTRAHAGNNWHTMGERRFGVLDNVHNQLYKNHDNLCQEIALAWQIACALENKPWNLEAAPEKLAQTAVDRLIQRVKSCAFPESPATELMLDWYKNDGRAFDLSPNIPEAPEILRISQERYDKVTAPSLTSTEKAVVTAILAVDNAPTVYRKIQSHYIEQLCTLRQLPAPTPAITQQASHMTVDTVLDLYALESETAHL